MIELQKEYLQELSKYRKSLFQTNFSFNRLNEYLREQNLEAHQLSTKEAESFLDYLVKKEYSRETISKTIQDLKNFYGWCMKKTLGGVNPFHPLKFQRKEVKGRIPSGYKALNALQKQYIDEKKRLNQSTGQAISAFRLFNQYLEEKSISEFQIRLKEAQELQTYLMTLQEESNIKYLKTSAGKIISSISGYYFFFEKTKTHSLKPFCRNKTGETEKTFA